MKRNNKKGFTIVELVIVIAVIAILAAVLIPTFSNVISKANESAALQACRNELVEMKVAYATQGGDIAEGTILSSKDYYFEYKDGQLVKCDKPNGTATELENIKIYNKNSSVAISKHAGDNRDMATITFTNGSAQKLVGKIYDGDGKLFYTETAESTSSTSWQVDLWASTGVSAGGTWTNLPTTAAAAEGYYTYEITLGTNTVITGMFYFNGK